MRIGVFDSGMGGLTVLAALRRAVPAAHFIYLGDTARLPYGTKSPATVTQYAIQAAGALIAAKVDLLVIACNTASAVAIGALAETFAPVPVLGVVEPGAEAGVKATRNRHVAVIATEGTVRGGAYVRAIAAADPGVTVSQAACPLFVGLAEEGWTAGPVAEAVAERYLGPLFAGPTPPDALVLGCTHFPVLRQVIQATVGPGVTIVDSAETTARRVATLRGAKAPDGPPGTRFLVTDSPERFARVGSIFLGAAIEPAAVELIDLAALA